MRGADARFGAGERGRSKEHRTRYTPEQKRAACEAYAQMPAADALLDRAAFYAETRCASAAAVQGLESEREQRPLERQVILSALERHGVLTQTRGRTRQAAKEEDAS